MLRVTSAIILVFMALLDAPVLAGEKGLSVPDIFTQMFRTRPGKARTAWFNTNAMGRTVIYKAKIVVVRQDDDDGNSVMLEYGFGDAVACKIPPDMLPHIKTWSSGDEVQCKGTLTRYSQSLGSIFLWVDTSSIERIGAQR